MPRRLFPLALILIAAGALAFRVPRLSMRPMHQDEAIGADKFGDLWDRGTYKYDPHEYHGPTLNYFTIPVMWLSGHKTFADSTEITYRTVPAIGDFGGI